MSTESDCSSKGPESLIWLITSRCNLACRHCYASKFSRGRELSEEEATGIIEQAAEVGVEHISFTGGEVFLRPEILKLLNQAYERGIRTTVVTNGLSLSDSLLKKLAQYRVRIFLSLDGTKEAHEKIRGSNTWEPVLWTARRMREQGMKFSTIMSLNKLNYQEVAQQLPLAKELGAKSACFIPVMLAGRAREGLTLSSRELAGTLKWIEEEVKRLNLLVSLWCLPFAGLVVNSPKVLFSSCRRGEGMDISPQGEVLLCDVLDISLGSVREGLTTAWRKQEENKLTQSLAWPKLSSPCSECELKEMCLGGCFARAKLLQGNIYAPDPLCPRVAGIL